MTIREYSPQQRAVFARVQDPKGGNILLEAVAGSGKTSTLVKACELMTGSVAFVAYNKKIADEIKGKVGHLSNVRAGTFHSFGYQAWSKHIGTYLKPDAKKVRRLAEQLERGIPAEAMEFVVKLVSLAKQAAFGVVAPTDECDWWGLVEHYDVAETLPDDISDDYLTRAIGWSKEVLAASNNLGREQIDFDDQLYLPLLFNARMWQNDWVLVDEAQDTNPTRRLLARKMLRPGGRLIAVGDPCQAIYGFTGANNDALDLIARDFSCARMPLTVSYRCPVTVVEHARQWVSHIEAAPTAPAGVVRGMAKAEFDKLPADALRAGDAVLCRNTAPLVTAAFAMIRRGIGAQIEGRDLGAGLLTLAARWKRIKTLPALRDKLDDYLARETQKLMTKGQELKAAAVEDRVGALQAIIDSLPAGSELPDLKAAIQRMFGDTSDGAPASTVILSTVHKSKGREWARVYLLGREQLMPSRYARQAWQLDQERNLIYVAITRSQGELIEVALDAK